MFILMHAPVISTDHLVGTVEGLVDRGAGAKDVVGSVGLQVGSFQVVAVVGEALRRACRQYSFVSTDISGCKYLPQ